MAKLTEEQQRFIVEEHETGSSISELTKNFNEKFDTNKAYQSFRAAVRSKWYAELKEQVGEFEKEVENPPTKVETEPNAPPPDPTGTVEENVEVVDVPPEVIVDDNGNEVTDADQAPDVDVDWPDEVELDDDDDFEYPDEDELDQLSSGYDEDGNEVNEPNINDVDLDSLPSEPPF